MTTRVIQRGLSHTHTHTLFYVLLCVSLCLRQLLSQNRDAGFQLTHFVDETSHHLQEEQAGDERLQNSWTRLVLMPHTWSLHRSTPALLLLFSRRV